MKKFLKYILMLFAVVVVVCSCADEPQTEGETRPELNGEVDYEFLNKLITEGKTELFWTHEHWRFAKDFTTDYKWEYNTNMWDGEVPGFPSEILFRDGKVYQGASAAANSDLFFAIISFRSIYYELYHGTVYSWVKMPFEFVPDKPYLGISCAGYKKEMKIENTSWNSFTLSRGYEDEDFGRFYVYKYQKTDETIDESHSFFFDSWTDFARFVIDEAEKKFGPDYESKYTSVSELREILASGVLDKYV